MYSVKMKREQKPRSGMALGGIGAGSFEIRHDGTTRNWTIFNNRPLGYGAPFGFEAHSMLFFVAKWRFEGEEPRMKLLQIEESHGAGSLERHEMQYIFPWLTGVDRIEYGASFPFARLVMKADDMPFDVEMDAWSPFVPFDEKNSSLPGAFFEFKIRSKANRNMHVTLAASLRNAAGYDVPERFYIAETRESAGCRGFIQKAGNVPDGSSSGGSMGLLSLSPDSRCYLGWEHPHPYYERFLSEDEFPEVNDVEGRNKTDKETGSKKAFNDRCWSTVAVRRKLKPGKSFDHGFVMSWCFPNNHARDITDDKREYNPSDRIEGHYYSNFFNDSFEAGRYLCENRKTLLEESEAFHKAFRSSSAPGFVLDQINSNLNTFFTSSWFTKDGHFGVIEGLSPTDSYAGLSTVDVAMYGGIMYSSLFPKLSLQVDRDYASFQNPDGSVAHSIRCNFGEMAQCEAHSPRLDLPSQHAFMSLRDALWSGDRTLVEEFYPSARAAIEYVLSKRDKNGDGLPDMEGVMCSYDNFPMFGVASFVAGQFIVALKTAAASAKILGRTDDEKRYSRLFESGVRIFEEKLWNGEYFRLYNDEGGANGTKDEGCLSDQLISQWAAHQLGLGHIFDAKKVRKALKSIIGRNYRDWQGLRNCQWPQDKFIHPIHKDIWVDQANTCWTGVELAFASLLLHEGMTDEAMMIIRTLDRRYRRNGMYFAHQEFGGHYFRPMSAWGIVNAMLGLGYMDGEYVFSPRLGKKPLSLFFAANGAFGTFSVKGKKIRIEMVRGELDASRITIEAPMKIKDANCSVDCSRMGEIRIGKGFLAISFGKRLKFKELVVDIKTR